MAPCTQNSWKTLAASQLADPPSDAPLHRAIAFTRVGRLSVERTPKSLAQQHGPEARLG